MNAALGTKSLLNEQWFHLLRDDAFYHVGSALIKHGYGQLIDPTMSQPEVLKHKLKAVRIIRDRIESWNGVLDNPTLLAILFLPAVEVSLSTSLLCRSHSWLTLAIWQDISPVNKCSNVHWNALGKLVKARTRVRRLDAEPFGHYTIEALSR